MLWFGYEVFPKRIMCQRCGPQPVDLIIGRLLDHEGSDLFNGLIDHNYRFVIRMDWWEVVETSKVGPNWRR
jgi:hypothetical protein